MIFHGRDQIHRCPTRKIRSRNLINILGRGRSRPGPPKSTNALLLCMAFSFGLAGWFPGGGSSQLGSNFRFGRNEVSVDDLFLNELD